MVGTLYNRLSCVLVMLSAATLCRAAFAGAEGVASSEPVSGITVQLSLPQKVFKGLPCLATVRVTAHSSGPVRPPTHAPGVPTDRARETFVKYLLAYPGFPQYDFLRGYPPLSVEMVDLQSSRVQISIKPARVAFYMLDPAVAHRVRLLGETKLAVGETRSFLVDCGAWFEDLTDGKYTVTVGLHNRHQSKIAKSTGVCTELVSPPDEVVEAVRRGIPRFPARISPLQPRQWLRMKMNSRQLQDQLPKEVFSQLAVYCFLSDVVHEGKIENARTELLEGVPDHLKEFAAALRYEVLLAKGEKEAAKELKETTLSQSAGMKWRFDNADRGNGFIQDAIKRLSGSLGGK
jgi:hypothetical protein